jgi:CO/xanthine dehydrogenase FAD-binding subunit
MKPAYFEYAKPKTVGEALSLLEAAGGRGKILAGGQSLIPMMNLRMARPEQVIDIKGLTAFRGINEDGGFLRIGALTNHCEVETDERIKRSCPILAEAAASVGHPQIRHRGTFGGSICHADPAAQFPTVITALEAVATIQGPGNRERKVSASDLFLGYLTTAVGENELLTEVAVPKLGEKTAWSFKQLTDVDGAVPAVCVAAVLQLNPSGVCEKAAIALGGVGATPVRAEEAERLLQGNAIGDNEIQVAAEAISGTIEPETDIRYSREYKAAVAQTLVKRALREALERGNRR